ncbi:MAG: hypothetical protein R3275_12115 [Saprospiraceae bacterium]|nr:hypothetical protein [Saprospiraceae bacterium]
MSGFIIDAARRNRENLKLRKRKHPLSGKRVGGPTNIQGRRDTGRDYREGKIAIVLLLLSIVLVLVIWFLVF